MGEAAAGSGRVAGSGGMVTVTGVAGIYWKYRDAEAQKEVAQERTRESEAARVGERQQRQTAEKAREQAMTLAEEKTKLAEEEKKQRERAEFLVYTGRIALAQREWEQNNTGHANDLLDQCRWDFRGWEHDYLHTLFLSKHVIFRGHKAEVFGVAFSPDGKRIVSGSWDWTVKVWDAATGQETLTLRGHTEAVNSVAFSPDGKRIVSGSGYANTPGEVKVWDAASGQETLTLRGHTGGVTSVAFSPDSKRIISGSWDQTLKVWDASTGQETLTIKGHNGEVGSVAFSPDGKRILSGSRTFQQTGKFRDELKVWDASTGQEAPDTQRGTPRVSTAWPSAPMANASSAAAGTRR